MDEKSPQTTHAISKGAESEEKSFPWTEVIPAVWSRRKKIAIFVAAATLLAVGITFLVSPLYTAETSILPELMKEKALGLSGISSLAEASGLNVGEAPVSKLYPVIVKSDRILQAVLSHKYTTRAYSQTVTLTEYWRSDVGNENEQLDRALSRLRQRMEVTFDARLGTVNLAVIMEEPQLAADVANQITADLDDYTRTKRKTNATLQREFIEARMKEVQEALERSELALKDFRAGNRRIADSPQLTLVEGRLSRDVQINSTVFIELKKQLEVAKIEEIKNIPIINVLDPARPPVAKSSPRRTRTAVLTFFLSLALAVTVAGFSNQGRKALANLQFIIRNHPVAAAGAHSKS